MSTAAKKIERGWKKRQKALFVQACAAIGWDEEQRHLVLSAFPNAYCGKDHPSSTSKKLTQSEFEQAMAVVEQSTKDKRIVLKRKSYATLYWTRAADKDTSRMDRLVDNLVDSLIRGLGSFDLGDFIRDRMTGGKKSRLADLSYSEKHKLIEGLKGCAHSYHVRLD